MAEETETTSDMVRRIGADVLEHFGKDDRFVQEERSVLERLISLAILATEGNAQSTKEIERLKALINTDKTGLAAALATVRGIAQGFSWIARGEWGSYGACFQTVGTLQREVAHLLSLIEEAAGSALRESGQRADAAFRLRPEPPPSDTIAELHARLSAYALAATAMETAIGAALTMEGQSELGFLAPLRALRAARTFRLSPTDGTVTREASASDG